MSTTPDRLSGSKPTQTTQKATSKTHAKDESVDHSLKRMLRRNAHQRIAGRAQMYSPNKPHTQCSAHNRLPSLVT